MGTLSPSLGTFCKFSGSETSFLFPQQSHTLAGLYQSEGLSPPSCPGAQLEAGVLPGRPSKGTCLLSLPRPPSSARPGQAQLRPVPRADLPSGPESSLGSSPWPPSRALPTRLLPGAPRARDRRAGGRAPLTPQPRRRGAAAAAPPAAPLLPPPGHRRRRRRRSASGLLPPGPGRLRFTSAPSPAAGAQCPALTRKQLSQPNNNT